MAKKKRFCQYPDCNKPIWHKGSSDYTTGNYCKEHRKPEYQKEIKNKADAERQRLKRKGYETVNIPILETEETEKVFVKTVRKPEHETRLGTTNIGASPRKKKVNGETVIDFKEEEKVIRKHKKVVIKEGKTQGAYATGFTVKKTKDGFTIPYIPTERERLLGTDDGGGDLAFNEDETGYRQFDRNADAPTIVDETRTEDSGLVFDMDEETGEWKVIEDEIPPKKRKSLADIYSDWANGEYEED